MRWLITLFVTLLVVCGVRADTFLYVSMAPEKKIQIYRLDPADGKLTAVDTVAVDGTPGAIGIDPAKKYLIVALRNTPALASFAIDPGTGKIKLLSKAVLAKGEDAAFVGTDRSGQWVISASYGAGKVFVHGLKDGNLSAEPVQNIKTKVTAHAFATDPKNTWVWVPHVAPNVIYQFKFNAETGKLTESGWAMGGDVKVGPRHLAIHPKLDMAYTSDESGSSITAYRFDNELGLSAVQLLSTLPADFKKGNSTAEVKIHPSGKFVWVSNRGHDSLAGFAIDAKGKLTSLGQTPTEKTPRSFDIDPDGQYVFGAGEGSGKLAVFRVDLTTGALTRIHTFDVGKSLPWVLAVKLPAK